MIALLLERARQCGSRTAVVDPHGKRTYGDLLAGSAAVARSLLGSAAKNPDARDLQEARIAFLVPPGFAHVVVQWGIWRAGGIAVPLCLSHPPAELEYVLEDADAAVLVTHPSLASVAAALDRPGLRHVETNQFLAASPKIPEDPALPALGPDRRAMLVYTSGTTGRPKGVVFHHGMLEAQVASLHGAWAWTAEDRILNVLPLHHVHGIVNVLTCALAAGAVWETLESFDAEAVWERIAAEDLPPLTLFMAVPTVYVRLLRAWEAAPPERRQRLSAAAARLRLMVSGSAALPVDVLERWQEVTGHVLLERYGMTEIGMALSNPLEGRRRPGHVGTPLPGVKVRLVGEEGNDAAPGEPGQLLVRGPAVFREYWRRPEETAKAFRDGWFLTGDEAVRDPEDGSYRLLGRRSVDILKTGGYKISALEIEAVLRRHPGIRDCAVVGLEDPEWGQKVAAAVIPEPAAESPLTLGDLRAWAREFLAPYKLPRELLLVDELPRNALGKVVKAAVVALWEG